MSEIKAVNSIDNNTYSVNPGRKGTDATDFSSYLGESQRLDDIFDRAASKYGVPVNLLKAVGKAESGFDENAVSRCGAQGIMQLMPATAKSLGVSNSFDPEQNIMGGAKYISGLLKKYDGDTSLALAAYNAGSNNVAKYGGIPPFKETQDYVVKVTKYMNQGGSVSATSGDRSSDNNQTSVNNSPYSPNIAYTIQSNTQVNYINNQDNSVSALDALFSYDNYMKFIDLFLNDNNEEDKDSQNKPSTYSLNDINFNIPVMNLLKEINN